VICIAQQRAAFVKCCPFSSCSPLAQLLTPLWAHRTDIEGHTGNPWPYVIPERNIKFMQTLFAAPAASAIKNKVKKVEIPQK